MRRPSASRDDVVGLLQRQQAAAQDPGEDRQRWSMATANMIWSSPRSSQTTTPIASRMPGIASRTSTIRIRTVSTRPPNAPASAPIVPPIARRHDHRDHADEEADPSAVEDPAENVAALTVGAEEVLGGRRLEPVREVAPRADRRAPGSARGSRPTMNAPMMNSAEQRRAVAEQPAAARRARSRALARVPHGFRPATTGGAAAAIRSTGSAG